MALVPYLDRLDLAPEDQALLDRPINLYRALAHNPDALRNFDVLPQWIRWKCAFDPRLREIAVLQVGYLKRSAFEYSHHLRLGQEFGMSESDIEGVLAWNQGEPNDLGPDEVLVLTAATEMTCGDRIGEATWNRLRERFGLQRALDLTIVTAFYCAVVKLIETLEVDVEPEYQPYLDRWPLPVGAQAGSEGK